MDNPTKELVKKRLVEVLYFSQVLIPHLHSTINEAEKEYSTLIEIFNNQFYSELINKLEKKYKIFQIYLEDLQEIKISFDEKIELSETLELNEEDNKFESLLIQAIAEVSILIKTIHIEIEEMNKKIYKEQTDEKDIKNDTSSFLNY